jgi:carbamoyl-phosphate synthase large subunit
MTNILVTGVGAIIGYGVLRSLRQSGLNVFLVGTDIYPDAAGQAWADKFVIAPLTGNTKRYRSWLREILTLHHIQLVIPGIEQDVAFFSDHREFFEELSVKVCLNDRRLINLTRDKWLMYCEMAPIFDDVTIPSHLKGDFRTLSGLFGLPFILKPRRSYSSKGLIRVHKESDFDALPERKEDSFIAQPIIGTDDEEYTTAIFGDGAGQVCASITLQRRLSAEGSTRYAKVHQDPALDDVVRSLSAHFKPLGPTNMQFRRHGASWKLLEINPRISSATSIRAAFGFNEAAMCHDFYVGNAKITQPPILRGWAVRYLQDYIVYDSARDNTQAQGGDENGL